MKNSPRYARDVPLVKVIDRLIEVLTHVDCRDMPLLPGVIGLVGPIARGLVNLINDLEVVLIVKGVAHSVLLETHVN